MRTALLILSLVFAAAPWARCQEDPAAEEEKTGFERFELVLQRNIFDPERRPPPSPEEQQQEERPPEPRVERLGLVGVYMDEEQEFALFGGSSPVFNTTLEAGETIADFEVAAISTDNVVLRKDGRDIELRVGAGLEKREDEDWKLAAGPVAFSSQHESTADSTTSAEPSSGGTDADRQEMLRRLMERRRQETGR